MHANQAHELAMEMAAVNLQVDVDNCLRTIKTRAGQGRLAETVTCPSEARAILLARELAKYGYKIDHLSGSGCSILSGSGCSIKISW